MFDCLLGVTARAVPEGVWRHEVVEVARRSAGGDGVGGRARELVGVAVFGIRLRSLRATAGGVAATWRQGAGLGGLLLLATALVGQLAVVADGAEWGGAVAMTGALVAAVTGRRLLAVGLTLPAIPLAASWNPVESALLVGVVALTVSASPSLARGRAWVLAVGMAGLAVLVGGAPVAAALVWVLTLVVPLGLLVVGGADARFAVAAAVTWSWRFLALDPTDVLDAFVALREGGLDVVLVRLCLMAWGVAAAVAVAQRSLRRTVAL